MAEGLFQGWSDDPFQLHEARYFSDGQPTKLVRDDGVESYDEPPAQIPPRSIPASERYVAADAPAGSIVPGFGPDAGWSGTADAAGRAGDSSEASEVVYEVIEFPRRSRNVMLAGAALLAAAAVVAAVVIAGHSGPRSASHRPAISAAAFVTRSAHHTLAQRTADINMTGTVQVSGQTVSLRGKGKIDFGTNDMALTVTGTADGRSLVEKEILIHGSLYLSISVNGKNLASATGGRSWIKMPVQESGSASLTGSDPLSSLSVLAQHGDSVRELGTKVVAGVRCTGYAVTPTKQAMVAGARKEFARLGFSSALRRMELRMIGSMTPPTVTVWFAHRGLVRQMSMSLQLNGLSAALSASTVMNFTHYGVAVTIKAPARSDTISYRSFLRAAGGNPTL